MALDHHERAWFAAVEAGDLDDALERLTSGRAGSWRSTNRERLNALAWAARHGAYTLVERLAQGGAQSLDPQSLGPQGHALLDWVHRADRAAIDAYDRGVQQRAEPRHEPLADVDTTRSLLRGALKHGWFDLAERWWPSAWRGPQPVVHDGRDAFLKTALVEAVMDDRVDTLAWLQAHTPIDWSSIKAPDLADPPGNLLTLAARGHATRVLPWLMDHGVDPTGALSSSPSSFARRPWLMALSDDTLEPTVWQTSRQRRWVKAWLLDPRAQAVVALKSSRFGPDLLQEMIRRQDIEMVRHVLTFNGFAHSGREDKGIPTRLAEHVAMAHQRADVLDAVLQRTFNGPLSLRHEGLQAAFRRWTLDQLKEAPQPSPPTSLEASSNARETLDPDSPATLLQVLVDHGLDLNAPLAQQEWQTAGAVLMHAPTLRVAREAGWDPQRSALAWPQGPLAYASGVLEHVFALGKSSSGSLVSTLPLYQRHEWADRWFGPQGWLRPLLTQDWWRHAWIDGTQSSARTDRLDWLIEALPAQTLTSDMAIDGLKRWSAFHSLSGSSEQDNQTATLDRWHATFGPIMDPHASGAGALLQQAVLSNRMAWMERLHAWFPQAHRAVRLSSNSEASTIVWAHRAGVNVNAPASSHHPEALAESWLRARHSQWAKMSKPRRPQEEHRLRNDQNPLGLCALLRAVGVEQATSTYRAMDQEPNEPLMVYAARTQDWDLVDLLLRAGADVNVLDAQGRNTLSYLVASHDKPISRVWTGQWWTDELDRSSMQLGFRLNDVAQRLLEAGISLNAKVPGKYKTLAQALCSPRHEAWIARDVGFHVAVERAVMRATLDDVASPALDPAVESAVAAPRRRL